MPLIERNEILTLVPHASRMCLIERVVAYDLARIECSTDSHRDHGHPLRRDGRLSALILIEYGAQAMAIHGALLARDERERALPGMLVAVRDFETSLVRLDQLPGRLDITAHARLVGADALIYAFEVAHRGEPIASGRASVRLTLDTPPAPP